MFSFRDIKQYHDELKTGKTDCISAVTYFLSNINSGKKFNAFVEVYEAEALKKATELDKKEERDNH